MLCNLGVSIPKRVSEALNLTDPNAIAALLGVSIPKRVSEALNLNYSERAEYF